MSAFKRSLRSLTVAALVVVTIFALGACALSKSTGGYIVTFESNGGTAYESVTTESKKQSVTLPTPEYFGHGFEGWFETEDFSGERLPESYIPKSDVTLYAKWSAIEYVVTFVSNGGTEYLNAVSDGSPVVLPAPEREDFIFAGWYLSADLDGEKLGESFTPTEDVILYAKWESAFALVSFETDGGTTCESLKDHGEGLTLPEPFKYGYEFVGWHEKENLSDQALTGEYSAEKDVTLYAEYRKVTYLYLYYGETGDYDRLSFEAGEEVALEEYAPDKAVIDGYDCPFIGWEYDDIMETEAEVPAVLTIGEEDIYIVAVYDKSALPRKERVEINEDGSVKATGNAIKVFIENGGLGAYTVDISVRKGRSGAALAAFRMNDSGNDYAYEDVGTYYIASGISPSTGGLYSLKVTNGTWAQIRVVDFADTPAAWQEKWNSAIDGELVVGNVTICDHGSYYETYIDGDYAYTVDISNVTDTFTGTGLGMRSSTIDATFSGWAYTTFKTVSFETNGGTAIAPVEYGFGKLVYETPAKENMVFNGWYYDEQLTMPVDDNAPIIESDITLYAAYRAAKYTVTLMKDGEEYRVLGYESGAISLPHPDNEVNKVYTGWYYDEECTLPVDTEAPAIESDITLYAGSRYPSSSNLSGGGVSFNMGSGTNVAAIVADTVSVYNRYEITVYFNKGSSGALGLAFRMKLLGDNSYEATAQYLTVGVGSKTGAMQMGMVNGLGGGSNFVQMTGSAIKLENLPESWQNYYTGAEAGAALSATITVIDYNEYFEAYLNGELCYVSSQDLSAFEGTCYGIRSSTKNSSFTLICQPFYSVDYVWEGGEQSLWHGAGDAIELTAPDGDVITENGGQNAYYNKFIGWSYEVNGEIAQAIAGGGTLYAVYQRVDMLTVSYDADNGSAVFYQYYLAGQTLSLPEAPFKQGYEESGTSYGYSFTGWLSGEEQVENGMPITENKALKAAYSISVAHTVTFVTNVDGLNMESSIVADGETLILPEPAFDGYETIGYYTDEQMTVPYEPAAVESSFTLYLKLAEKVEITFINGEEIVSDETIIKGGTVTLPAATEKAMEVKANGNTLTYTFARWELIDGTEVTENTTFDASTEVYAAYTCVEKRRVAVVTYDENGEIYTFSGKPEGGFVLPGVQAESAEFSFTIDSKLASKTNDFRICLFTDNDGELVNILSNTTNGSIFLDYYLSSGIINLGSKITGSSGQPWSVTIASLPETSAYKNYMSSLSVGDDLHVDVKVQYGVKADNSGWIKAYLNGELMIVYGLTQDELNGETVYGKICDTTNSSSSTARTKFINWMNDVQYHKVGWHVWQDLSNAGGTLVLSKISFKDIYTVTAKNGEDTVGTALYSSGRLYLQEPAAVDGKAFDGWFYDEQLTMPVDLIQPEITSDTTLYAGWSDVAFTITFINEGETISTASVGFGGTVTLPDSPEKAAEIKANGNTLNYTFARWQLEGGEEVTDQTTFEADTDVYAVYNCVEKRRVAVVTYDENGEVYTFSGTPEGGFVMPDMEEESAEFSFTFDTKMATKVTEFRVCLFTNNEGALVNIPSNNTSGTIFLDYYLNTGVMKLGSKITGTSGQPWGFTIASLPAESAYKNYISSLSAGDDLHVDVKVQYGVKSDNSGWIKAYLNGELMLVYGLTEEELNGETVYGLICTDSNSTSTGGKAKFIAWMNDVQYYKIGWHLWQTLAPAGGSITFSNVSFKNIHTVTAKNGEDTVGTALWSSGKLYLTAPEAAGKTFTGWFYDEDCTLPVDMDAPEITGDAVVYAGWAE